MPSSFAGTLVVASLLASALLAGTVAAYGHADPLATYRGKARIVVAVAPSSSDPKLARQREIFAEMRAGARERDLVLVEAVGESRDAQTLRQAFGLDSQFHAVLVGKDGTGKLTSAEPLGADRLFPLIDSMPMRQEEMKRQ